MLNFCGAVFSMTNAADINQIISFARHMDGTLTRINAYNTGGSGTGVQTTDPLMSQGSLIVSPDKQMLFAVNAGSNSISSFAISLTGELSLVDVVPSGGDMPNSLALYGDILYVANHGNTDKQTASSLTGFRVDCCGKLRPIPCASYVLSSPNARPACIAFSPCGDKLIVSELSSNQLTVFPVCCNGRFMQGTVYPSNGAGPFGSVFLSRGLLLVAEAGANALSSYTNLERGQLVVVSGSVLNGQTATCWVSIARDQRTAYTSNAGSDSISIYDIQHNGVLSLRKNVPANPNGTAAPLDSGVSSDGKYFYVLNGNEGTISVFAIAHNGDLTLMQVFRNTGLPQIGAQGLAVF